MFLVLLNYKRPLEDVQKSLTEHNIFLKKYYDKGYFLLSGGNHSRTGGILLAKASSKDELTSILCLDPFYTYELADFDIVEFAPSMTASGLEFLL